MDVDEDDDDPLCTLIVSLIQVLKAKSRCIFIQLYLYNCSVLYSLPTLKSQKGRRELRHEGAGMLSIGEMSTNNFFSPVFFTTLIQGMCILFDTLKFDTFDAY